MFTVKNWTIISFIILTVISQGFSGTVMDDFDDEEIDEELWTVLSYENTGEIEEKDGMLSMGDLQGGWDGIGVKFNQIIDFSQGEVSVEYFVKSQNTEFAFSINNADSTGDPYSDAPMREFLVSKGTWESGGPDNTFPVTPAYSIQSDQEDFHKYLLQFTPTDDQDVFDLYTEVDEGTLGTAEATIDFSTGDPTMIRFYFTTVQDDGMNETSFLDWLSISSPSIEGNFQAIEAKGKLATMWARLRQN